MNWQEFLPYLLDSFRISSYQLEKQHGISSATISNIKRGRHLPTLKIIKAIEKALDIKINFSDPNNLSYFKIPHYAVPQHETPLTINENSFHSGVKTLNTLFNNFPVVSVVRAGTPNGIHEEDILEYAIFDYPQQVGVIAVKVIGDSMNDDLHHGDIVLVDKNFLITNNSIVVAVLNDGNHTIKRYRELTTELIELYPANKNYQSLIINKANVQAIYKVVRSLRKH